MCLNLRLYASQKPILDDPSPVNSYIPAMFTEVQMQYIEEVLGINHFGANIAAAGAPAQDLAHHPILVLTPPLNEEQKALLSKILGSIKLQNFAHQELPTVEVGRLPEGISAQYILAFTDGTLGRAEVGDGIWWVLPSIESMMGANADVVTRKKEAWNWLQQFAKEQPSL